MCAGKPRGCSRICKLQVEVMLSTLPSEIELLTPICEKSHPTSRTRRALQAIVEHRIAGVSQPIHRLEPALDLTLLLFLTTEQFIGRTAPLA